MYLQESYGYVIICKEEMVSKHILWMQSGIFVSKNNRPNTIHWVKPVLKKSYKCLKNSNLLNLREILCMARKLLLKPAFRCILGADRRGCKKKFPNIWKSPQENYSM